jgi:S-adenosylmethionine/arginine decarboxylase-like enzyme
MIAQNPPLIAPRDAILSTDEAARLDARMLAQYSASDPWGLATAIDLGGCDPQAIRDPGRIERFVIDLCDLIEMKRFGDPVIVRFGAEPRVSGYSLVQLIETSLISGHFAEESDSAYIDVFSCKAYPPYRAALFCREWFGARSMRVNANFRFTDAGTPRISAD